MVTEKEVKFAVEMIPHHEMALKMARKLLDSGSKDPVLVKMAKAILSTQAAEIETLKKWLADNAEEDTDWSGDINMDKGKLRPKKPMGGMSM